MYLKVVIDRTGNTHMIKPEQELDFVCPFCKTVNTYILAHDSNLFCNYCGKRLVTQVNDGNSEREEEYSNEQISDFIRILKEGGSFYDRTDAITSLGKISRNNKRIGIIFNLLHKISISEPDPEVRGYAMEALDKLGLKPVIARPVTETEALSHVNEEKVAKKAELSPFKTYKIEDLPDETRQQILLLNENKTNGKSSIAPGGNGKNTRNTYSMEDELLSLLNDI
ncbi:MAG: hypothetical protein ABRQ38_07740 [Candidatus Eremiobacterota bacterium]